MTIDFFEKEVKRLQDRFNENLGKAKTVNMGVRTLAILAICRADIITKSIRETSDEKRTGEMTREFCRIRVVMNGLFDLMESNKERSDQEYAKTRQAATG